VPDSLGRARLQRKFAVVSGIIEALELTHKGVKYDFDYDFAPSDGTGQAGHHRWGLDGSIHIKWITVSGKDRPVTVEVLKMMERAAAIEEYVTGAQSWVALCRKRGLPVPRQLTQRLKAVSRLEQTSVRPPAGRRRA
jgi:hypothetical protein